MIAPNKNWILENCEIKYSEYLDKFPGKYTFILKLKDNDSVAKEELLGEADKIGVRIPNNWFAEFVGGSDLPFVTTSVNLAGEPHITKVQDTPESITQQVDYMIDDDILENSPSQIIDLTGNEIKVLR